MEIWKSALHAAGFETANAIIAIRLNLAAFRKERPAPPASRGAGIC
jgi:hypothetical protein